MEKEKKKQIAKISVFITSLFVIFISVTYAFINMTLTGTRRQVITAGNIALELLEDENNLTIVNAMPMYDEVGMVQDAFTFRLVNKTATDTNYILRLVDITTGDKLSTNIVKYGLTKDNNTTIGFLQSIGFSSTGTIRDPEETEEMTSDDELIISPDFTLTGALDKGIILGNQTIEYSLRLWIDSSVEDNKVISGKSLSYRIDVEASQEGIIANNPTPVSEKAFATENLGENCKTYNDGVDTFLVGQCQNNYLWYSGKLWRVVLKNNETGAVKMVTDNAMTVIQYNEADNPVFENSYADQWLNQEFLPTLHDYQDYLVTDSIWDSTSFNLHTPIRPDGKVFTNRAVGLLNAYEYYTTYNNSDELAIDSTGYLFNGMIWWLLSPGTAFTISYVSNSGNLESGSLTNSYSIRPAINMKSEIPIISGDGTISNPYRLYEYKQYQLGLSQRVIPLNTSYIGEYVKFNNELYRIVNIEDNLTKITAVNKPSSLSNNEFHSESNVVSFANTSIKTDLESYYQGLDSKAKNMIEPNTVWYLGTVGVGNSYKANICATVDANVDIKTCAKKTETTTTNIGLPRIGEILTSQISRTSKSSFWTLTPLDSSNIWFVSHMGDSFTSNSAIEIGARPSMYLKQNVVIVKDNTGDGTYEHPFDIELGL